jgi:hypothetical protein
MITLSNAKIIDHIGIYPNAYSPLLCEEIMQFMDNKFDVVAKDAHEQGFTEEEGYDLNGVRVVNNQKRIDKSIQLTNHPSASKLTDIFTRVLEQYSMYHFTHHYGTSRVWSELDHPMQLKCQKSSAGGGFCQWHYEQGNDWDCARRLGVWMVYLNDVTEGGKTEFRYQDMAVKPEQGTLVIWPAAYTHKHRAAPDLNQDKYIVTGWYTYEAKQDPLEDNGE